MKKRIITGLLLSVSALALAKLPPPSDEAKTKAAEAAAKTAWTGKVEAYQLCKSQDKVAAHVKKTQGGTKEAKESKASAKEAKAAATVAASSCADPGPFVYTPPVPAGAQAAAGAAAAPASPAAAKAPAATAAPAAAKKS